MSMLRVAVLAFDGVSLFHLSVPGMVFGAAKDAPDLPHYEVRYCAAKPGQIRSEQGVLSRNHGHDLHQMAQRRTCSAGTATPGNH